MSRVAAGRRPPVLPAISEELSRAGLMGGFGDFAIPKNFGTMRESGNEAAEYFRDGGYGVIVLPPELFGPWKLALMRRLVKMVTSLRAPRNEVEAACYGVLNELARLKKRVTPQVLVLGLCLASAKSQRVAISTHPRDLAKEAGVRYATLLLVRRISIVEMEARRLFVTSTPK